MKVKLGPRDRARPFGCELRAQGWVGAHAQVPTRSLPTFFISEPVYEVPPNPVESATQPPTPPAAKSMVNVPSAAISKVASGVSVSASQPAVKVQLLVSALAPDATLAEQTIEPYGVASTKLSVKPPSSSYLIS